MLKLVPQLLACYAVQRQVMTYNVGLILAVLIGGETGVWNDTSGVITHLRQCQLSHLKYQQHT